MQLATSDIQVLMNGRGQVLNPRGDSFDIGDLVDSIRMIGQTTPISVYEMDGGLFLQNGHRRLAACIEIGCPIEVTIVEKNHLDNPLLDMLASNVSQELPLVIRYDDGVYGGGIAGSVETLVDEYEMSFVDIASLLGETATTVSAMYNVKNASDGCKEHLASGDIRITTFQRIAQYSPVDQDVILSIADGRFTSRAIFEAKRRFDSGDYGDSENPYNTGDPTLDALLDLASAAGESDVPEIADTGRDVAMKLLTMLDKLNDVDTDHQTKTILLQAMVKIQTLLRGV